MGNGHNGDRFRGRQKSGIDRLAELTLKASSRLFVQKAGFSADFRQGEELEQ